MTDDRTLERAARSWLEEGPTEAPDHAVAAALSRIESTSQVRDLRVPWIAWRPRTMLERIAVVAIVAVLGVGTLAAGAALILNPPDLTGGPCPPAFDERHAVDTFEPGLTQTQRAWGIEGGQPGSTRSGAIAAFAWDAVSAPLSVITLDPATGVRCQLLRFKEDKPIRDITRLRWSPSGDALAMGIENPPDPAADGDSSGQTAQVLIWTRHRLLRVWSGEGQVPGIEWAPDGRSVAVWMSAGGTAPARIIAADGSPDRVFGMVPAGLDGLQWSPDGSRWIVAEGGFPPDPTRLSVVDVATGRVTPIDVEVAYVTVLGWLDDGRVLLFGHRQDQTEVGYMDVPIAAPASYSVFPVPPEAALHPDRFVVFSRDWRSVAYSNASGEREIAVLADSTSAPIHIDIGTAHGPGPAWAPDGSQLVYVSILQPADRNSIYALWTVNADGSGLRQIAASQLWTMDDPWQPVPAP